MKQNKIGRMILLIEIGNDIHQVIVSQEKLKNFLLCTFNKIIKVDKNRLEGISFKNINNKI